MGYGTKLVREDKKRQNMEIMTIMVGILWDI